MASQRSYDKDFKIQSVKLANEIGINKAAAELGIASSTLGTWVRHSRLGKLDLGLGTQQPDTALTLVEEVAQLRAELKARDKEIKRLKEENEFLEEASAFFAASRQKLTKH